MHILKKVVYLLFGIAKGMEFSSLSGLELRLVVDEDLRHFNDVYLRNKNDLEEVVHSVTLKSVEKLTDVIKVELIKYLEDEYWEFLRLYTIELKTYGPAVASEWVDAHVLKRYRKSLKDELSSKLDAANNAPIYRLLKGIRIVNSIVLEAADKKDKEVKKDKETEKRAQNAIFDAERKKQKILYRTLKQKQFDAYGAKKINYVWVVKSLAQLSYDFVELRKKSRNQYSVEGTKQTKLYSEYLKIFYAKRKDDGPNVARTWVDEEFPFVKPKNTQIEMKTHHLLLDVFDYIDKDFDMGTNSENLVSNSIELERQMYEFKKIKTGELDSLVNVDDMDKVQELKRKATAGDDLLHFYKSKNDFIKFFDTSVEAYLKVQRKDGPLAAEKWRGAWAVKNFSKSKGSEIHNQDVSKFLMFKLVYFYNSRNLIRIMESFEA